MIPLNTDFCFCCFRKILVTYINSEILLEDLQNEMRAICQFTADQEFTMKWIDEEGQYSNLPI